MAIKRKDTGEIITFGEQGRKSSRQGSGWNANDQTYYGNNLTLRRAAEKVVVVDTKREEEDRKRRLEELRKQYVVGDTSAENKEILRQIREEADIKPNWVQRTLLTGGAAGKNYAGTVQNTGGFFLETMGRLNDAAFETEYADQIRAAKNSHDYWSKVLAETQDKEERKRAQMALDVADNTLKSIAELKEMQSRAVDAAASRVYDKADKKTAEAEQMVEQAKDGAGNVAQFLVDVGYGGSQLAADVGLGIATGGGALLPMAVRTFGGATQEARQAGASYEQQLGYGAASTSLSIGTERLVSLATPLSKAFGGGVADEAIKKLSGRMYSSAAGRTVLNALGEGGEEMIEAVVDPLLKKIYDSDAGYDADTISNVLYSGLLGAVLGGGMGTVGEVGDAKRAKSMYAGSEQELVDEALELDENSRTAKNANKRLEQGKALSGATLNNLVRQNEAAILRRGKQAEEETEEDKVQKLIDALTNEKATEDEKSSAAETFLGYKVSDEEVEARRKRETEATMRMRTPTPTVSDFTEEEARSIVDEGAKEFGNAASSVVNSYMRSQDPQLYMAQAKLAFNYGKTMSEEKGLPYALNSPALKSLDETQIRSLFNAGRMQAKSIPVSAVKGTGKAVMTDGLDYTLLSPVQKKQVDALSAFAKATGYTIELFESKAGADGRYTAEQGSFNTKTGVIRIDINAGRNAVTDLTNYAMVRVASHEITHSFKKNAPKQYVALRDYVTGVLADKGRFEDLVDTKMRDLGIDHETAVDEVVADGCEMLLRDTRFAENLAKENRTLFEKIRDAIRKFVKKLRDAFEGVEIAHEEALLLKDAENLQKLWDEALAKSVENVAAAELAEAGIAVNEETESGSLYSVRDVLSDADRKKVSKMLVKQFGVTETEAMSWLKAETSMASLILNPKYSMYLDYEGDPNEVAIKQNSDYPQGTVDFSNICKKRREFTQVMNRILRNFPNHVFAATDLAKIRTIMGQEGMTLPCGICYVEDRRQLDTIVAQDFIDSLKSYREGSKTRPNGKPFNPNQLKGLEMTNGDTYVPSIYELVTLEGRNALKAKNPNMEAAWVKYNNARGMQAVRLLTNEAEYKRQILKYSPKTVQSKNDHGGLRIYSFSDAEMFHLIDIVQVITDSAAVGLKIQGYTKVNEYAKAVRNTGLKLNRSLIPAGDLGYHMEDGRVVLDYDPVEGIDIHHKDFFDSTDNPNVGNIVIGINDTQIRAAMVSDFVDMVIPFHTGQSEDVLGEKGIAAWENYKDYQTEKDIATGKTSKHQINIYTEVIQAAEQEGNPIRNKRQFVEKFLAVCKANGLKPRFAQFLNTDAEGNYVYTEGYHKFLVDFKMFAQTAEGEYLPQMVVKPIFDDTYVTGILESYVEEQQTKDAEVAKQMPRVIERITDEIIKPEGVVYSKRSASGVTKKDQAKVASARVEMYRGMSAEDIPDVDYIPVAEYNKVNEAYVYTVRNHGYLDFEIVSKKRVESRFEGWVEKEKRHGENGTRAGKNDVRQGSVSRRYESGNRTPAYGKGVRGNAQGDRAVGDAGQTDSVGSGNERDGVSYSFRTGYIPTDRSILTSYVPKDSDSNMVKRHIAEYQKNLEELRNLEQTLREQREQMRSLTGDENKVQRAKLREEIVQTQNRIQIANDQLRRKESWMGVRTVLNREKDALVKQAKAEEREKLTKYREQRWDTESRRKMRERISYRVKTLDKMLRNPTDDKHIPDGLQSAILDFCEAFTENTSVFSKKRLYSIRAEYSALEGKVSETSLADLYDESIKEMLEYLGEVMSGKRLSELDMEQLSMVRAIADHFAFMVKNENEIFVQGRKVKLDETAQGVISAANEHKRLLPEISKGEALDAFDKILTSGNLRPVNFFRDKGSNMRGLFQSLLDAQDEYAFRMDAAKAFVEDVKKSTGYSEWSGNEQTLEFTNAAGQKVKLDIQQAMSLLATYERELRSGNLVHVTQGGFVYEKDVTGDIFVGGVKVPVVKQVVQAEKAKAHPMSVEDMDKVRSWLGEVDPRVLDYMERMVEYLSTTMSEYGNETSMQLHGYKKFGEGYYFPIKPAKEFLQQEPGKAGFDDSRWKHKGFTKATVKGANNPFVLRSFDEVWSNHVSQMCMYSTMAVPQDAFVRVMNYKTPVDPTGSTASVSVKSEIRGNYGQKSLDYIDTYLSDINGGLLTDPRAGALNRMVSLFKKNAVFASLSVALQQPSAVVRAMTMVDGKYFAKAFQSKPAFEEAKQYSGLAIIKQIGGFDTTTGRGGAEWMMQTTPEGLKAKAKAFVQFGEKDKGYRDSVMTILPQKMDEISWGYLWNAVKAEIADTTDLEVGTEAFFEAVAKRFEEVIENTQVYDSVLTRSENMRGKDGLIKAATSFMAEPTVTMNMFSVAVQDALAGKEGVKAHLARTALVLALSIVVNNLLKAIATAPRDKDEDETIAEKYLETVVSGVKSDLDPFGYAPLLRDVKSIWQGYTVEASYASVISDIYDAWNKFSKNQTVESGFDVVNSVAALFGVPAKNLKRDIMSAINIFAKTAPLSETSKRGFWNAFREGWGVMPDVEDKIARALKADRNGNAAARKKALDEIVRLYEDKAKQFRLEGKQDAAKKAKSSLKSSITAELKPLYQAATTQEEKNRIKSLALRVYVGGEQLYNGYDFERYWGEE